MSNTTTTETTTEQKLSAAGDALSKNIYPYALAGTLLAPPAFFYPNPLLKRVRLLTGSIFVLSLDLVLRSNGGNGLYYYVTAPSRSWVDWAKKQADEEKLKKQNEPVKDVDPRRKIAEERVRRRNEADGDMAKELLRRREEKGMLRGKEAVDQAVEKVKEHEQLIRQEVESAKSGAVEVGMSLLKWWRKPESWSFYWNPEGMVANEVNQRREG